jgi:hypothetical protein
MIMITKAEAIAKLDAAKEKFTAQIDKGIASIDARESMVDGWILSLATWLIDKPWTARLLVLIGVAGVAYGAWEVVAIAKRLL